MSILSTNTKLIKVGQDYSAGSGISIDDHTISVTGEFGKTYSAGDNISIYEQGEQLYISSKDWEQDIANASANAYNEAVAQIPDPFDPSFISGQVDNKLDATAFTNWQNGQYSTDLQTIENQISNKLDESAFGEVSGSFLTAINIPESATWNEVSQAYENASSTYLTSVNIPESAVWQDVSTTVQTNSAQWAEGGAGDEEVNSFVYNNSATINEVNTTYQSNSGSYQPSGNYIPYTAVDPVFNSFVTNSGLDVTTAIAGSLRSTSLRENFIEVSYINSNIGINNNSTLTTYDLTFSTSSDSAYVDREKIHTWDSASNYIQSNSANWNDVSTTVQSNSAQWAEVGTGGDPEVNSLVHTNSATWNSVTNKLDFTAFSTVSGTFLTDDNTVMLEYGTSTWAEFKSAYDSHKNIVMYNRDTGNIINQYATFGYAIFDETPYEASFTTVCFGTEYRFTLNSNNVWKSYSQMYQYRGNYYSASNPSGFITGVSIPESATWNDVSTTVQSNSSVWGTSKPAKLIGWNNYQGTAIDQRAAGINGGIIATVFPDFIPNTMSISSSPYTYMNGMGFYEQVPGAISSTFDDNGFNYHHIQSKITASMGYGDIKYEKYNKNTSSTDTWSLTGSVQKREIEYDADTSAITAIAGSALAGGGDVPSGTMNVSGLEYNAVNEISAYNGSAIAQYGAEKQWLVHDDTLVHAANSAQYALGVNLSAVAQLLGVDETVLYSGTYNTATKSIVFSEPLSSFERIMVLWNHMNNYSTVYGTYDANGNAWFQHGGRFINTGAGNCYDFITQWNIAANRLSANFYTDMINQPPTGCATKDGGYNELIPVKVIGIGRKA